MFFRSRRRTVQRRPEPYAVWMVPPSPARPLTAEQQGLSLRGRRRPRENDSHLHIALPLLAFVAGFFIAAGGGRSVPWILAVAFGASTFFLYVPLAYVIEGRLRPHRRRPRSTFLGAVIPRFPAAAISLLVLSVWVHLFYYGPESPSPVSLFLSLMGIPVALAFGKILQWALQKLGIGQASRGPPEAAPQPTGEADGRHDEALP